MIRRIDTIEIENVKGIDHKIFRVEFIPNKPTLIVAPNGFGKSSITAAFLSLNSKRLELHKDHYHMGNEALIPRLKISYVMQDGTSFAKEADPQKNEIANEFDTYTINSQLISKAKKLRINGASIVTSAIEVQPIVLVKTIPQKIIFNYSYATAKADFGPNGKVLPNISGLLKNNALMAKIFAQTDFSKQSQVGIKNIINDFKAKINSQKGSTDTILANIPDAEIDRFIDIPFIKIITNILSTEINFRIECALAALQISEVHAKDKTSFKKASEYAAYSIEKSAYEKTFSSLKGTWKKISPKEVGNELVIEFPKAHHISNGERDIICFVAQLKKAGLKFKKQKCILVIDEIFDYLDDANLVACQYYLTEMIEEMRAEGRQLFPLIMTHLSPSFFRNYTFNNQKVCYLDKCTAIDRSIEKIIINRSENTIEENISKHFLHFHNQDKDLTAEFNTLGLPIALGKASSFSSHCDKYLQLYLEEKNYDPLAVCCAVRRKVEEKVYNIIDPQHQAEFLSTHKTANKLDFAESKGAIVPDIYYLLGVIYNEALHLKNNQDNFSVLGSKLGNLTIKHMIRTLI